MSPVVKHVLKLTLRWSSILTAVVVLACFLIVGWLFGTQSGLTLSVNILSQLLPALQIEGARGSWASDVSVDRLAWQGDEHSTQVALEQVSLRWQVSPRSFGGAL